MNKTKIEIHLAYVKCTNVSSEGSRQEKIEP